MNYFFLVVLACTVSLNSMAQKPLIDLKAIDNWEGFDNPQLSPDGEYFYYTLQTGHGKKNILKSIPGNWEVEIPECRAAYFSKCNKYFVYESVGDSIVFFSLGQKIVIKSYAGNSLKVSDGSRLFFWLANNGAKKADLVIWNIIKEDKIVLPNVVDYYINSQKSSLYYIQQLEDGFYKLATSRFIGGGEREVWRGQNRPEHLIFDPSGEKLAFITRSSDDRESSIDVLAIYDNKVIDINNGVRRLAGDMFPLNQLSFNKDGSKLIIAVTEKYEKNKESQPKSDVSVNVWHYQDEKLQSQQLNELNTLNEYAGASIAFYDFQSKSFKFLGNQRFEDLGGWGRIKDVKRYILFSKEKQKPDYLQLDPHTSTRRDLFVRDLTNYTSKMIINGRFINSLQISPNERFVIYYDPIKSVYYSFEIATNKTVEISKGIMYPLYNAESHEGGRFTQPEGISGWSKDGSKVYINDEYDIWEVPLNGIGSSVCVTGGFGRKNRIRLRFQFIANHGDREDAITSDGMLILHATSLRDYKECFLPGKLSKFKKLEHLDLSPYLYTRIEFHSGNYMVVRSDGVDVSNCFISSDLKSFKSLTDIHPQRKWNWYTKELIDFKMISGGQSKCVVYKPENFDSTLKYPVIFTFYQILSDKIYETLPPRLSRGRVNPAWMCSRGYIVVEVDIPFKVGYPGQSAFNSVVSAAKYFSKLDWVDSTRMGLSGASHGAFSVNYIISHTPIFAAAASSFGIVDMISGYGATRETGFSRQYLYETSQERIGTTLWESPDLYIENSSVFQADKVQTPVLILHNKDDVAVPWSQGLEWFLALRRNGKKVWMLQYDGEGHDVYDYKNRLDYNTRLEQFFDHFLKGKPAPIWLKTGIPASRKGFTLGLEYN